MKEETVNQLGARARHLEIGMDGTVWMTTSAPRGGVERLFRVWLVERTSVGRRLEF